ncbi:hypothetical protein ACF0H5_017154 [Mactra antiquata]
MDDSTIESRIQLLDHLITSTLNCDDDSVKVSLLSRDGLLDALLVLYDECGRYKLKQNKYVNNFLSKYKKTIKEIQRLRIQLSDFEVKDVIGRGHFGEVQVVRDIHTETVYAMKTLRKQETLAQAEVSFYEEERDIMALATSPWITKLHYAFQDAHTLYLIMEFHAGGDLLSLLGRHDDIFDEKMAKFYLSEIVVATHDLHEMGYVHRDLKPENVLIDCTGHIKLADFGSAAKLSVDGLVSSKRAVGTPDYVSPELLNALNNDIVEYHGVEVDWWSLGVCMYEMLFGKTPFTDESGSMVATYSNIMNYKAALKFPSSPFISSKAESLIRSLLTETDRRLNYKQILKHAFFDLVIWDKLREVKPPFVPQLQGLDDTSNFEEFEKIKHSPSYDDYKKEQEFSGKDLPFVGFTYAERKKSDKKKSSGVEVNIEKSVKSKKLSMPSVDVTVTMKVAEMERLREKCNLLEESECGLKARVETLKMALNEKDKIIEKKELESEICQRDLEHYTAKTMRLSKQLEVLIEEKEAAELTAEKLVGHLDELHKEAKQVEGDIHQFHIEELQEVIALLEEEKIALVKKVSSRDKQIHMYKEQLEKSQDQVSKLNYRLEKERRKSRDDRKRDLTLLKSSEDILRDQLEEKNIEILDLNKRLEKLEEVIEAAELQERKYLANEQELREKLKNRPSEARDVDIHVLVHTSPSPKKDRRLTEKFRELEDKLDQYEREKEDWGKTEEELRDNIETTSRQSCKLERLERQLEISREKELSLRMRKRETSDFRIKLAEERVSDLEAEKQKLEAKVKALTAEVDEIKEKQTDVDMKAQSTTAKVMAENLDLKLKLDEVNRSVEKLEKQISKCERNITDLEEDIENKNKELKSMKGLRMEKMDLERQVTNLESQVKIKDRKLRQSVDGTLKVSGLEREKENLETKVKSLEKELADVKSKERTSVGRRVSKFDDIEHLKQEKSYLETRVSTLTKQIESGDRKVTELEQKLSEMSLINDKVKGLETEISTLKKEKLSLQDELHSQKVETDKKLRAHVNQNRDVQVAEDKLEKEREKNVSVLAELRRELSESNLALSEARSLLSATERQAKHNRDSLEADIRELQHKLYLLEKEKGMHADDNEKKLTAKDWEDLQTLRTENEELVKKYKDLESKISGSQREKCASLMEKQLLKESLAQKEHQCEVEARRVEKLTGICGELETQIKDLEAMQAENEAREAEWNKMKQVYEKAVEERENDLEGVNQRLNVLKQFRQESQDKAQSVKEQLQVAKDKHKSDIDALKKQLADVRSNAKKKDYKVTDLEMKNSKMDKILEQQKMIIDNSEQERHRLKEEISKVITETQEEKRKNIKLRQNLEEAVDKLEIIFGEKIDLENFTEALQGLHFLEKYRFESTIDQQMKLIDYLQDLWQDSVSNKKKKGGKIFGKGKDGIPNLPIMGDLQSALDNECKKNRQLQEQIDRLRNENFTQANELLKVKGALREKVVSEPATMAPNIKAAVQVLIQSPTSRVNPANPLLTPSVKRSSRMLAQPAPTPQRMHHKIPHRFVNGLNTRATKCAVCLGSVPFVKQTAKCQECSMVCHPKCTESVGATCGLPTEYIKHFTAIMERSSPARIGEKTSGVDVDEADGIKMEGWLKIPKSSKQTGWEKRWCKMEGNILLLFNNDFDANPVDTFDLSPPNTDVTIHSAISVAELPSTAATDLPCVLRLEHEPLTTCWPGRVLYLMATNFVEKQKWVASLEAGIRSLQRNDGVRRSKLEVTNLLELSGSQRLELNCSLRLSKQLTLLGADEGLFAVNLSREPPVVTKLNQFDSVYQLKYIPELSLIILVAGEDRKVLTIDKKLIQFRLCKSNATETKPVFFNTVEDVIGCTVFDAGVWNDAVYMCVGMADKVAVMKYNIDVKKFCMRKELSVDEPCSCLCMADSFVIVGTDRFYKINLDHPSLSEFVDKKDNSLAFAAFGAAAHKSYPLAVVQVSPFGLPLEYLLCFHEYGVYVDSKGRRSRPADMKWSCLPLSFAYKEPFLYVTYFHSIQAITVPACKEEIRGRQTSIDLTCPRYLGPSLEHGSVYVSSGSGMTSELLCVKGKDGLFVEPLGKENKENTNSVKSSSKKSSGQTGSQGRTYSSAKYKTGKLCRRLSLTSMDSNSSVSSTSTVSSYGSSSTQTEV